MAQSLKEKLDQLRRKKVEIERQEKELLEQIKDQQKQFQFGDVVTCVFGKRIMLWDVSGELCAFDKTGGVAGRNDPVFYTKTGQNIFIDNSLNLAE